MSIKNLEKEPILAKETESAHELPVGHELAESETALRHPGAETEKVAARKNTGPVFETPKSGKPESGVEPSPFLKEIEEKGALPWLLSVIKGEININGEIKDSDPSDIVDALPYATEKYQKEKQEKQEEDKAV